MNKLNKNGKDENIIGVILTQSTTSRAVFQLRYGWERTNRIFEGMIVLIRIKDTKQRVLGRIESIVPNNELFRSGNIFSDARKNGIPLPSSFAQSWVLVETQILLNVDNLGAVTIPPSPGDKVFLITPEEAEEYLFKRTKNNPDIKFGHLHGYAPRPKKNDGIPIPLNIDNLPMHIGIFGVTGGGKSYDTGVLIERLLSIKSLDSNGNFLGKISYPSIIIDAHGDYLCYFRHAREKSFVYSSSLDFNLDNFRHFVFPKVYNKRRDQGENLRNVKRVAVNFNLLNPREISELIVLYYHGVVGVGEKQITTLTQVLRKKKESNEKLDLNKLISTEDGIKEIMNFIITKQKNLSGKSEEEYVYTSSPTKNALERILTKFYDEVEYFHQLLSSPSPFKKEEYIDTIIMNGLVNIIDFSAEGSASAEIKVKQFFMSYLATILFNRFRRYNIEEDQKYHLFFLIEEAQIYCPSSSYDISASLAKEKIRAIATQGRKFGLALGIITQRPSFVDQIVLSQLNSFVIHRIAAADISLIRKIVGNLPESILHKLTTLRTGNIIISGQMNFLPFPLWGEVVGSVERLIKPDVGEVKPSIDLYNLQNKKVIEK
ncbi:MAG: DUF87 domain-containing protein [Candidatus Lokiarchaeota archaeon]|nr:DUF87 domain-containing protein [Candidatus Lokiarchaeota archaeon]